MPRKPPPAPEISPELLGLLRAAKDDPEEDAPRLILADWLDDHGQADRAELIRVQCELARLEGGSPRKGELYAAEKRLLEWNRAAWVGPLGGHGKYKRGLFHARPAVTKFLSSEVNAWLSGEAGFWLASLSLNQFKGRHVKRLASRPYLTHVRSLEFYFGEREDVQLPVLLASPNLTGLREFTTIHVAVLDAGAFALAGWGGRLTKLSLCGAGITDAGAAALAAAPSMRDLRTLGLHDNAITDAGAIALASSPHLANLRTLYLVTTQIKDAGARALAASPHLAGLERLTLTRSSFSPAVIEEIQGRFPTALGLGDG